MDDVLQVANKLYKAFDDGDLALADTILDDGFVDYNPPFEGISDKAGILGLIEAVSSAFRGHEHSIDFQEIVGGDTVVTAWRMTGMHVGTFLGAPASGRPVTISGIDIVRVRDGKLVAQWHAEDLLGAVRQMRGAT